MSNKTIQSGLSAITNEVLGDVQKEAETLILEAEARGKETLRFAKENADQTYKTSIDETTIKVQAEKRRVEALAEVESRNQLLQTKEALVDEAFDKAFEKLRELAKSDGYREQLLKFVEEAASKLGGDALIVRVNAEDQDWLAGQRLNALSKKLKTELELASQPETFMGGCIVQTADGKLTYDNTLENRLQQMKPKLRLEVAKILFGKEEEA